MNLPNDTFSFIQRWLDKIMCHTGEDLENYFDRFFSTFVLYNFLYCLVNEKNGYRKDKDSEAAVCVARKLLGADRLFNDESLKDESQVIRRLINDNSFYIRDSVWDESKIRKIETSDPEKWSKGLLEIV